MRAALLTLLLTACATGPGRGDRPNWRAVEGALVASLACDETDGVSVCHNQPRRAVLARLDCVPAGERDRPGRVLCRYAGRMSWMDGRRGAIASECATLSRDAQGRWAIDYYPDSEFCAP